MKYVISVGGSLLVHNYIDTKYLCELRQVIMSRTQDTQFFLIAGGGATARQYIDAAKEICSVDDTDLDWLGIHATRLNGHLLRTMFRDVACPKMITSGKMPRSIEEPVVIAAGWEPGNSTDYVAIKIADHYDVDTVINLTNTSHVCDRDPRAHRTVKRYDELTWADYRAMCGDEWTPGSKAPFGPIASREAQKRGIKVIVARGDHFRNLENILDGKEFIGTTLS